jgi:tRNA (cmo5U34)-methyltransferase
LIPETLAAHRDRLIQAGFDQVLVWYQCFNFVSILALKNR